MGLGKVIIWSDEHHPYIDGGAHEAIYQFAKDVRPDYHILIGDCLNLGGISRHVQDDLIAQYEEPVEEGLVSLGKHINKLWEITPRAKIVWIWGNHDERLRTFARRHPSWRGIVDDPIKLLRGFGDCSKAGRIDLVQLDDADDEWKLGKMHFCHGHYTGKHCAAATVEAYSEAVTFGHAHTMQMFTAVRKKLPVAGYCVGHLMSREARKYLKGRPVRWVTGFGYMEYDRDGGEFTQHLLPIVHGQFRYGGKTYGKKEA